MTNREEEKNSHWLILLTELQSHRSCVSFVILFICFVIVFLSYSFPLPSIYLIFFFFERHFSVILLFLFVGCHLHMKYSIILLENFIFPNYTRFVSRVISIHLSIVGLDKYAILFCLNPPNIPFDQLAIVSLIIMVFWKNLEKKKTERTKWIFSLCHFMLLSL